MSALSDAGDRSVVDAVMRTVAAQPHPVRTLDLPAPGCRASVTAVAGAVRIALDAEPGLVVRRCRLEAAGDRRQVVVWVSLAMRYAAWRGADAVRDVVVTTVLESFGLGVERVDVDVVDVELPEEDGRP